MTQTAENAKAARLAELSVRDFAIIDALRIEWGPGLNVLTGETGAGKSIIVDALGAVLGDRMDSTWVRAGAERAWVEAVFCGGALPTEVVEALAASGAEPEYDQLILTRDVSAGRSASRINARTVPLAVTQQLAERLVDLHSQASHLSLTRAREHLGILDRYAGLAGFRAEMATAARALIEVRRRINEIEEATRQTSREAVLLRHEVEEIDAAAIRPNEEQEIEDQRLRLKNALRLRQLAEAAYAALHGRENRRGAVDLLSLAAESVEELAGLDPRAQLGGERLTDALDAADELARNLRRYADELEEDPTALEAIEERLLALADLKRKYGATLADVLAYRDRAAERLDAIEHHEERIAELRDRETELEQAAARIAGQLSQERHVAVDRLERAVERELADLGMGGARLAVAITSRPDPHGLLLQGESERRAFDETGADQAEFLIAANPGEPPRPLARVASGGELARFMLALKSVLSEADETPVLIFDELDQGVGGRMGHVIGEKLWRLAQRHQVLCITHLPQVAAYADNHFLVSKATRGERATTAITRLSDTERVDELALMLGGAHAGPAARQGAEELVAHAEEWKARSGQ
jgi:DNA repair protein RecN (Recombination protein N)